MASGGAAADKGKGKGKRPAPAVARPREEGPGKAYGKGDPHQGGGSVLLETNFKKFPLLSYGSFKKKATEGHKEVVWIRTKTSSQAKEAATFA